MTTKRKRVNFKGALVLVGTLASVGAGLHVLHGFQVKRNAHGLLERAQQLDRNGDTKAAAALLTQYLRFEPGDFEARTKSGQLLLKQSENNRRFNPHAYLVLSQALNQARRAGAEPGQLRRELGKLALEGGRLAEAREHLAALPEDAETMHLRALCETRAKDYLKAANFFARAAQLDPKDITLRKQYATLLHTKLNDAVGAKDEIENLVEVHQGAAKARLAAIKWYFFQAGDPKQANRHVQAALKEQKTNLQLLLQGADVAEAEGQEEQARRYLVLARQAYPHDPRPSLGLARIELDSGHQQEAVRILQDCFKRFPAEPMLLSKFANRLLDAGAMTEAQAVIEKLEELQKGPATYFRARQLMHRKAWAEACAQLQQLRTRREISGDMLNRVDFLYAECEIRLGHPEQAELAYASAQKDDPDGRTVKERLAATFAILGRWDRAIASYRKLLPHVPEVRPELAKAILAHNLQLSAGARRWDEIERLLNEAPEQKQKSHDVPRLRANLLIAQGKLPDARRLLEAERDRDPKQVGTWLLLAVLAEREGNTETILPLLEQAEKATGKSLAFELWRARYGTLKGDSDEALKAVEVRVSKYADRETLLTGLADAYLAGGDLERFRQVLLQIAQGRPVPVPRMRRVAAN